LWGGELGRIVDAAQLNPVQMFFLLNVGIHWLVPGKAQAVYFALS
jgi:hypothetical protein